MCLDEHFYVCVFSVTFIESLQFARNGKQYSIANIFHRNEISAPTTDISLLIIFYCLY